MSLDRTVVQESKEHFWIDKTQANEFLEKTKTPYLTETPFRTAQIPECGQVLIKDESKNPTGTVKDHFAKWMIKLYEQEAQDLLEDPDAKETELPRVSIITAGNIGLALSYAAQKYGLPPPKLLVDIRTPKQIMKNLRDLGADIYVARLDEQSLTPAEILTLTNNEQGIDLTSRNEPFYTLLIDSVLAKNPTEIYIPYGSGTIFESFVKKADSKIKILGAKPLSETSIADKLTTNYNPFATIDAYQLRILKETKYAHEQTGTYRATDEGMKEAQKILEAHCPAEISAAAGLALYIKRWQNKKIDPDAKVIIVNTGKGKCSN